MAGTEPAASTVLERLVCSADTASGSSEIVHTGKPGGIAAAGTAAVEDTELAADTGVAEDTELVATDIELAAIHMIVVHIAVGLIEQRRELKSFHTAAVEKTLVADRTAAVERVPMSFRTAVVEKMRIVVHTAAVSTLELRACSADIE